MVPDKFGVVVEGVFLVLLFRYGRKIKLQKVFAPAAMTKP